MSSNQKEVLEEEVMRLRKECDSYKIQGQAVYNDMIRTGSILFKLMNLIGIEEIISLPSETKKAKILPIIMKKASALLFSKDSVSKFEFLSDILPIHEKYKPAIEAYLKMADQTNKENPE